MAHRKDLPRPLKRALLEEAGYRCAIPTCGATTALEFAHIEPHAEGQDDSFDNLIVLCSNDHYRFDKRGEIPRQSIVNFKLNLGVLNSRYSELERRLLTAFYLRGKKPIDLEHGELTSLQLQNLVRDKIMTVEPMPGGMFQTPSSSYIQLASSFRVGGDLVTVDPAELGERVVGRDRYTLTDAGQRLIERWYGAEPIADVQDEEEELLDDES